MSCGRNARSIVICAAPGGGVVATFTVPPPRRDRVRHSSRRARRARPEDPRRSETRATTRPLDPDRIPSNPTPQSQPPERHRCCVIRFPIRGFDSGTPHWCCIRGAGRAPAPSRATSPLPPRPRPMPTRGPRPARRSAPPETCRETAPCPAAVANSRWGASRSRSPSRA